MHIIDLILSKESLTLEDLWEHIDDHEALSKTLYFMDKNNIFKLLSLIGVLDKQYYYDGHLLYYDPPLQVSYVSGTINYIDKDIVEAIAPDRMREGIVFDSEKPFESTAQIFKELSRDEEMRLTLEASKGNEAAQTALIEANFNFIVKVAKSSVSKARKTKNIDPLLQHVDLHELYEDLYLTGQKELFEKLPDYYQEYKNTSLGEFMVAPVAKATTKQLYEQIGYSNKERRTLDEPVFRGENKEGRKVDGIARAPDEVEELFEEQTSMAKVIQYLKDHGYREDEIAIFEMNVEGLNELEISKKMSRTKREVSDILQDAKEVLKNSDLFSENEENDNAYGDDPAMLGIRKKGGIDFNANALPMDVQGGGMDFNFPMPAELCIDEDNDGSCERMDIKALETMPISGFTPIIFQIVPVTNINGLLGIADDDAPFDSAQDSNDPQDLTFIDKYRKTYFCKWRDGVLSSPSDERAI